MAETRRPFRFGVSTRGTASRVEWRALAQRVEALGYSTLLMPDHVGVSYPLAPIAAVMAAADATTTLRLGCHLFGNDFRHPVVLAKELATIDVLSGGRLELGIGTGWMRKDYDTIGIPLDRPGVRVDRLSEAVRVVKGCFGDRPFGFSGTHYTVRDLDLRPKPVQRPHPPIVIGGGGPRVLGLAGREADVVALNFRTTAEGSWDPATISAEATEQKIGWVRAAAGERFAALEIGVFAFLAVVTSAEPERVIAGALDPLLPKGAQLSRTAALASPAILVGSVDQIVEKLVAYRERFGISYVVIRDSDSGTDGSVVDAFAPVVGRLAGL